METFKRFTQDQYQEWYRHCNAQVTESDPIGHSITCQRVRKNDAYLQWQAAKAENASPGEISSWKRIYDRESYFGD